MLVVERVLGGRERPAVERHRLELELVAVEHERRLAVRRGRIALDRELRAHAREVVPDVDVEIDGGDQERGRRVVLEVDRDGRGVAHGHRGEPEAGPPSLPKARR